LSPPTANDYQGDTTIAASQTISGITGLIMGSGKNNLMPFGGAAGDLILAGGSGSLLAIFDLNGTTQNINGLIATNGVVANAIVTNSANATPANLIIGNDDADAIFGGAIKNGAGGSVVTLTKVGAGIEMLSGNNTYTGNTIISNGVLALSDSGSISSSAKIIIDADGTLDASARADQTFTLSSGQMLQGNGTVSVNLTVGASASVMPGDSVNLGALNVASAAQLQGVTIIKLNAATTNCDQIIASDFIYGGTLTVTNISGAFAAGQTFQLFLGDDYSGSFSGMNLPPLGGGLVWNTNNLAASGTLQVVSTIPPSPVITGISLSGGNVILSGTNGVDGQPFVLLSSTNVELPLNQWSPVSTNTFGGGSFSITNAINQNASENFYLLQLQ
jgi:autotransporter-associated beta strand protein